MNKPQAREGAQVPTTPEGEPLGAHLLRLARKHDLSSDFQAAIRQAAELLTVPSPAEAHGSERDAQEQPFEDWWEREGQFGRAGGGQYEKTFAWNAWCAASKAQPKGMPAGWQEAAPTAPGIWLMSCRETNEVERVTVERQRGELWAVDTPVGSLPVRMYHDGLTNAIWAAAVPAQAPAPAPELSDEDILRIWRKHYPTSVPGQLTIMAARDVIAADRTRQAPAVMDGKEIYTPYWQGGLSNAELAQWWRLKTKAEPTDRDMSCFALGVEVGCGTNPAPKPEDLARAVAPGEKQ